MLQTHESTQWLPGAFRTFPRQLAFGETYEDPAIELQAMAPRSRVFSIAGAGYTAQALAGAGHRVTAVDISPAQLDYARARIAGGPARAGAAERLLGAGRHLAALCGWTRRKLDIFLELASSSEQVDYWDRELDTLKWRALVDTLLAPRILRLCYRGPFVRSLPSGFGPIIRRRLRRGWASHLNRFNPFAALLLVGKPLPVAAPTASPIRFVLADAAEFLEGCAPGSFDAFTLSNIGDGASSAYMRRLHAAVERAAAPEAIVISRSFGEPADSVGTNLAAIDRAMLWGTVAVCRAGALGEGGAPCCIG
jgi:S-adenosylmethionine:diacylglycerol 3-amino-3-carboxypropyl transferase